MIILYFPGILAGKDSFQPHFCLRAIRGNNYPERNKGMDKILLVLIGCTMVIFIHRGWKDIKDFWVEFLIAGVFLLSVLLYRKWSQKKKKVEK